MEGAGDGYKDEGGVEKPSGRKDHSTCIRRTRENGAAGRLAFRLLPGGRECYMLLRRAGGNASGPKENPTETIFP